MGRRQNRPAKSYLNNCGGQAGMNFETNVPLRETADTTSRAGRAVLRLWVPRLFLSTQALQIRQGRTVWITRFSVMI
jgi:hypothetical protein